MKEKILNVIIKYRDPILLTIGTLLVVFSICLLFYDRIELIKSNVFAEVEMEKYREKDNTEEPEEETNQEVEDAGINDTDVDQDNLPPEPTKEVRSKINKEYIVWKRTFPRAIIERTEEHLRELERKDIEDQINKLQKQLSELDKK